MSNGSRLPVAPEEITLIEVCDAYLDHCQVYYVTREGVRNSTLGEIRRCLKRVLSLYRDAPAAQFAPNALRTVRKVWIDKGNSISTINTRVGILKRMFKLGGPPMKCRWRRPIGPL